MRGPIDLREQTVHELRYERQELAPLRDYPGGHPLQHLHVAMALLLRFRRVLDQIVHHRHQVSAGRDIDVCEPRHRNDAAAAVKHRAVPRRAEGIVPEAVLLRYRPRFLHLYPEKEPTSLLLSGPVLAQTVLGAVRVDQEPVEDAEDLTDRVR